jgi:hypothetical protein
MIDTLKDILAEHPGSAAAYANLAAAHAQLGRVALASGSSAEADQHLEQAEAMARRATEVADDYFMGWANLGNARLLQAYAAGTVDSLTAEGIEHITGPWERAEECHSMDVTLLNNYAEMQIRLGNAFGADSPEGAEALQEAAETIRRAIRLVAISADSECGRIYPKLGHLHDTERGLHEALGDENSAFESARRAVDWLATPEGRHFESELGAKWRAHVVRLEGR